MDPVPPHASATADLLAPGLRLDWGETSARASALAVPRERLSADDRYRWNPVRAAADDLSRARRKSEFATAYGVLLTTCAACHQGQVLHRGLPDGHAGAFRALELSVATGDRALADEALGRMRAAPDLGPSQTRFVDLATKIREARSPESAGKFLGRTVLECFQCHGAMVP